MPDSDDALKQARAAYDAEASGLEGARFIEVEGMLSDILERAMPYCDLLLLERLSSSEGPDAIALNTALWEGRSPVLVMPPQPATGPMDRIVLSWNGTLQAGRALRAAMPLVANAGSLVVLTRAGKERDTELERYLSAHKISVSQWKVYGNENLSARAWARSLLAEVTDLDAGLLVMGAFGGAVSSFLGFGRATEKIATSTRVPVLFSA
jgi:nucleotide-binding universal stress UspA family protein